MLYIPSNDCKSQGIIRVTSMQNCVPELFDQTFLIIRSEKSLRNNSVLKRAALMKDLAPSEQLFFKYLNEQRAGRWNQNAFNTWYRPQFIAEINANPVALQCLDWLVMISRQYHQSILLCCFCPDERMCHRSIVTEMLRARGAIVITDDDAIPF